MTLLKKILISFFGLGFIPGPSGTYGSVGAAAIFVLIALTLPASDAVWLYTSLTLVPLTIVAAMVGIALGRWAIDRYGVDPSVFVLDEVAGMFLAVIAVPFADHADLFYVVLVQFLLFRLADIVKPQPCRSAEKFPAGYGIVTDDLIAGLYANIGGQLIFRLVLPALAASPTA